MTKRKDPAPTPASDEELPEVDEFDPYAPPEELSEPAPPSRGGRKVRAAKADTDGEVELDFGPAGAQPPARRGFPKVAIAIAIVVVVAVALIAYRSVSRRKALRTAIAQAEVDARLDTADGYRKAAEILSPFTDQDPLETGSMRAFSLGMLALDYRDTAAA